MGFNFRRLFIISFILYISLGSFFYFYTKSAAANESVNQIVLFIICIVVFGFAYYKPAKNIKAKKQELVSINEVLDDKVKAQTRDLLEMNLQFNNEIEPHNTKKYLNMIFYANPNIVIVMNSSGIIDASSRFFEFFDSYNDIDSFKKEHDCICEMFEYIENDNFIYPDKGKCNCIEESLGIENKKVKIINNGKEYYFKIKANKIDYNGEYLYIVTFTDITELQNLKNKFEKSSIIDDLTGLYNRRHFNKIFKSEIGRAHRSKKYFTLAIIDIDNFKKYNDRYGHLSGDKALKEAANAMKSRLHRASDYIFRLGGEEFGIIFLEESKEESLFFANNIRLALSDLKIEHVDNKPYNIITASIGLCHVDFAHEVLSKDEIYLYADKALYKSKTNGKNRVMLR